MTLNLYDVDFSTETLNKVFDAFNTTTEKITIYIRSGGGKISILKALTDFINENKERCEVVGFDFLGSSAFMFFLEINCDKRLLNDTIGMLHQVKTCIDMNEFNKPYYYSDEAELIRQKQQKIESQKFIKNLGLTEKEIRKYNKNEDLYFQHDRFLELTKNYNNNKK